ncbi:MAG TPA: hypothetical protein ENN05_06795 [Deltaproteobacteria bacterium]|nr:hypothetical protein [Deltaproteobacteria bacterium]
MIHYIKQIIFTVMGQMFGRDILGKQSMKSIDFSDILENGFRSGIKPEYLKTDFKSCLSMDEYNKDFLNIFEVYRKGVFLDYSHKDGHFRV